MSETPNTVGHYIELDSTISDELKATTEREKRTKRAVIEIALTDYIARSKADAKAARAASKTTVQA